MGTFMKIKDIMTDMPLPSKTQQQVKKDKDKNKVPNSGALFKAQLDLEKSKG